MGVGVVTIEATTRTRVVVVVTTIGSGMETEGARRRKELRMMHKDDATNYVPIVAPCIIFIIVFDFNLPQRCRD